MSQCADCKQPFERGSCRGPAPRRCPRCTKVHKGILDRTRACKPARQANPAKRIYPCCSDAGGTCPQHKQARKAHYDEAKYRAALREVERLFIVLGITDGDGYAIRQN